MRLRTVRAWSNVLDSIQPEQTNKQRTKQTDTGTDEMKDNRQADEPTAPARLAFAQSMPHQTCD